MADLAAAAPMALSHPEYYREGFYSTKAVGNKEETTTVSGTGSPVWVSSDRRVRFVPSTSCVSNTMLTQFREFRDTFYISAPPGYLVVLRVFHYRRFGKDEFLGQAVCNFGWDPRIGATSLSTYSGPVLCRAPLWPRESESAAGSDDWDKPPTSRGILEFSTCRLVSHGPGLSWDPPTGESLPPRKLQIDPADPLHPVGTLGQGEELAIPEEQPHSRDTLVSPPTTAFIGGQPVRATKVVASSSSAVSEWEDPLGVRRQPRVRNEAQVRRSFSARNNPAADVGLGKRRATRVM